MKVGNLKLLDINVSYYYNDNLDTPSAITLILLHGGTLNKESMLPLGNLLLNHNIIIPDLKSHGDSSGENCLSVEEHTDFIEQFLEELSLRKMLTEKVVIVGYCLSGVISLELGRRNNHLVNGIIALSSSAKLSKESAIHDALNGYSADSFNYLQVFRTGKPHLQVLSDRHLEIIKTLEPHDICYQDLHCVRIYDRESEMSNIKVPTLLISGDSDVTVPLHCTMNLRNIIPNSVLKVIPFVGHALLFTSLNEVAETINTFAEKL